VEKAVPGTIANQGYHLQHHGRYCHVEDYVRGVLEDAGISVQSVTSAVLRLEMGQPVEGLVVSACMGKREDG
jgi:predicted TPR repeat methyltransferase